MNARALAAALRLVADAIEAEPDTSSAVHGAADLVDARASGLGPKLFRRLVREGVLNGARVGRRYLVRRGEIDLWLATRTGAFEPRAAMRKTSPASQRSDADDWADILSTGTLRVIRGSK